jgi:hypothetical protein
LKRAALSTKLAGRCILSHVVTLGVQRMWIFLCLPYGPMCGPHLDLSLPLVSLLNNGMAAFRSSVLNHLLRRHVQIRGLGGHVQTVSREEH